MIRDFKILILSILLHHANRISRDTRFYAIKNKILAKYGKHTGYDIQYIEGKKCRSCGGTGHHKKYSWSGFVYDYADCWHCFAGWYKMPVYVLLERVSLGEFTYHQPQSRHYSKRDIPQVQRAGYIEGYVQHTHSKYGNDALTALYLMYDFKWYARLWLNSLGTGYRYNWRSPRNWLNNIAHLVRYRQNAIPITRYRIKKKQSPQPQFTTIDELPF